jgi:hypothetical protein
MPTSYLNVGDSQNKNKIMHTSNYKIWIKSLNKFWHNDSHNKSTWTSLHWVMTAAEKVAVRYGEDDVEVHEYPLNSVIQSFKSLMRCVW